MTQMEYAQKGVITPQIRHVAAAEQRSAAFIAERVAAGTVVIPANINHKNLVPCGIGRELKTKINANLGNSTLSSCPGAFDWEKQFELALDPQWAKELRQQALQESSAPNQHGSEYCTMCGPDFCSVRLSARLKKGML